MKGLVNIDIVTYTLCKKTASMAAAGISDIKAAGNTLIITTVSGKILSIDLPIPEDGISVTNVSISDDNELVVTLSDGNEINAGKMPEAKVTVDGKLSDESENPVANKIIAAEIKNLTEDLQNTVKLKKNTQTICSEDIEGMPMHAIVVNTNIDSGHMTITPNELNIRCASASDISPTVAINGSDGITLYDKPLTLGSVKSEPKMIIKDNYIESNTTVNFSTVTDNPSQTSKLRINPNIGSVAMSEIKSTYESTASATGISSIAVGSSSSASGQNSIAIGKKSTSTGTNSVAIGNSNYMGFWTKGTKASGTNSIAIGDGVTAASSNQVAIGKFNENKDYNVFEVGNGGWSYPQGSYSETFSTAFSVDSSGNAVTQNYNISGGVIETKPSFSISASSGEDSIQTCICSHMYDIFTKLREIRHKSNSNNLNDIANGITSFDFTIEWGYQSYKITAERMAINNRGVGSFCCEYSWIDSSDRYKCVVDVSFMQSLSENMSCSVRKPAYKVCDMTPFEQVGYTYVLIQSDSDIEVTDTGFYFLSVVAEGKPVSDLYMVNSFGLEYLSINKLTGNDNDIITVTKKSNTVITISNSSDGCGLKCTL